MKKPRSEMIGVRLEPEVKATIEKLAEDDERSMASMLNKILKGFLRQEGLLAERPRKAAK